MKAIKKGIMLMMTGAALTLTLDSCTDGFVDINSNVATIYDVDPERFLFDVQRFTRNSSWEWYYDYYLAQMRWNQYGCRVIGNTATTYTYLNPNIFLQRYNDCFMASGSYMKHMEYYVKTNVPEAEQARYSNAIEAARVSLIYQGIITSDSQGSLAYTQGWALRSGGDITEPAFDTQESLYGIWDGELKTAISKFKSNTDQVSLAGFDAAYNGDMTKWVKAANALRLRIALRYMKRDMAKAKAIATEVLATPGDLPGTFDDSFIFWLDGKFSDNGDYYSINDLIRSSNMMMDYLNKYNDPRRRMFFRINNLTPANVSAYNAANPTDLIPADFGRWMGGTASFDKLTDARETSKYKQRTLNGVDLQAVNKPQTRVFGGYYDGGSGGTWYPNVTHADFCFMAAEFVLEGVSSSKTAEQWYTEGVESSLRLWNKVGSYCKIHDYEAMTNAEITEFMNQEGIKWNPATGKEQIWAQTFIEDFKNSNEGWCLYRRTGYPNANGTILKAEVCTLNGTVQQVPRRARFSYPVEGTVNYANQVKRIDDMATDPDFGNVQNEFGRLWWDKK